MYVWQRHPLFFRGRWALAHELTGALPAELIAAVPKLADASDRQLRGREPKDAQTDSAAGRDTPKPRPLGESASRSGS